MTNYQRYQSIRQLNNRMTKHDLSELKELILHHFHDDDIKIFLFGSRARNENIEYSDVDVGLLPSKKLDASKIVLLREKIENSNIPYKVDIVNVNEVSEDFKKEMLKDAVIWND